LEECTFSPNLNYSSLQPGRNINDFLERQKIYEELKKEKQEAILSTNKVNDYTFKPKINLTSDILMRADADRASENQNEKYERLCNKNYEKIQKKKEQLQQSLYAQYDYKPKINEVSRIIASSDRKNNKLSHSL
jgi:hypothetical protein